MPGLRQNDLAAADSNTRGARVPLPGMRTSTEELDFTSKADNTHYSGNLNKPLFLVGIPRFRCCLVRFAGLTPFILFGVYRYRVNLSTWP